MPWTYLGAALVFLVILRLSLSFLSDLRRARVDARRQSLELAHFKEELAMQRETRRKLADSPLPWNGFRKFVVKRKAAESSQVSSFYLVPHDAKTLPGFKPGQYLTFRLPNPQRSGQLIRCYSLSDRPHAGYYRVTIKRALPPPGSEITTAGLSSGFFHDHIHEGDIVDVRAPAGNFSLEPSDPESVVLIGGGIGLTPIYSMLTTLLHQKSRRSIWFFYGVRNRSEHLFKEEFAALVRDNPHVHLRVCYSQPGPEDQPGEDYHTKGRVTVEMLKQELPSNNFRFYYCGPGAMMESLTAGLRHWGVPDTHLHFETFGPLSVKRVSLATVSTDPARLERHMVTFRKSGMALPWDSVHGSLLDLAESAGVVIASGCRAGNCGTCVVAMQSGEVTYLQPPGSPPEARTCLTCIAQPKGDVVLDA